MQQATRSVAYTPSSGNVFAPPPASPRFVVNLCSSTTPVALVQPTHAGLKRFTFFVSRRLEEGRERFRLHMGYFESQEEAERMLDLVRDVYPAAWAGVAPGIKLRARAAQAASEARHAGEPAAAPAPVAVAPVAVLPAVASAPSARSAPAAASVPDATSARAASVAAPTNTAVARQAAPAHAPTNAPTSATASVQLGLAPDLPRAQPAPDAKSKSAAGDATRSLVDVRAAIESLGDSAPHANGAVLEGEAVLQLLSSAHPAPAARVAPVASAALAAAPEREVAKPVPGEPRLSAPPSEVEGPAPQAAARPRQATRSEPAARAEPALFAVQLLWSVQPIDIGQVAMLAIFSAYTLYGAEGNRDGRRWYGLRLGFFTDAVSAKQVAQYVRSEFKSVSVVPVSERERGRANAATAKPVPRNAQRLEAGPELNFIDDVPTDTAASGSQPALTDPPVVNARDAESPEVRAAMAAVGMNARPSPGKRVKPRAAPGAKPAAKRPRPLSLEETLEILGAGDLSLEKSRGELMNDQARRDRKQSAPSSSKFGRLINRLAERLGNG